MYLLFNKPCFLSHILQMEGDDDDFLGGVIEFGDGRQYKVEATESAQLEEPSTGTQISKENRFVDDYDRSWPKSQSSPASSSKEVPPTATSHSKGVPTSPVSPHPSHSPHDSSRVLFNERSNRLEPYSRQAQPPFPSKRAGYQEGKDVQLLQKPSASEYNARNRRLSASSGTYGPTGVNGGFQGDKFRDRESNTWRDGPPLSPRATKDQHTEFNSDRGRKSNMGPPPVPFANNRRPSDGGRQLPPHLSQVSPSAPPRRLSSRDSRISPLETTSANPATSRIPPISPAVSHASLVLVSPKQGPAVLLPLNAPELDDARKDVMQTAAARAKQRRQQEEAEREAQKERARRKAAELEEKMKTAEAERQKEKEQAERATSNVRTLVKDGFVNPTEISELQEQEAVVVIEEAIQSASSQKPLAEGKVHDGGPGLHRPPSLKPVSRDSASATAGGRRTTSFSARVPPSPAAPASASQQESWRSRAHPLPPSLPAPPHPTSPTKSQRPSAFNATPSALDQVETIAGESTDQLEVVDFSDMDKFVSPTKEEKESHSSPTAQQGVPTILSKPPRPIASDFFDDPQSPESSAKTNDFASWRRKVSVSQDIHPVAAKGPSSGSLESGSSAEKPPSPQHTRFAKEHPDASSSVLQPVAATKEALIHAENGGQIVHVSIQNNTQRTPRGQTFYNDAAMSSLDDAMSRIKGALVGMQTQDSSKSKDVHQTISSELVPQPTRPPHLTVPTPNAKGLNRDRWVPPALRTRKADDNEEPRELLVTIHEPPRSPAPASSAFRVCLPSSSRRLDQIPYHKVYAIKKFSPVRLDILSFDPPIPEMIRTKDLVVNNVLFRRPYKGAFKYVVRLPRHRGPRTFIPGGPGKSNGSTFGRSTVADDSMSWRKPATAPAAKLVESEAEASSTGELDTMSRSPPPEPVPTDVVVTSIPKPTDISPTKSESNQGVRARSQPKMPVGSAVAFLRDSRIDVVERDIQTSVKFIVGSELEGLAKESIPDASKSTPPSVALEPSVDVSSGKALSPVSAPLDLKEHVTPLRFQVAKTDSKSSDDSVSFFFCGIFVTHTDINGRIRRTAFSSLRQTSKLSHGQKHRLVFL